MFLLDIRYDPKSSTITKWIKDGTVCKPVHEVYYPKIYVSGKPELLCLIASLPGVKDVCFEEKTTWLGSKPEKVISATFSRLLPNHVVFSSKHTSFTPGRLAIRHRSSGLPET